MQLGSPSCGALLSLALIFLRLGLLVGHWIRTRLSTCHLGLILLLHCAQALLCIRLGPGCAAGDCLSHTLWRRGELNVELRGAPVHREPGCAGKAANLAERLGLGELG